MVNFTTRIPDCDSQSLALLDLFISSKANIKIKYQIKPHSSPCFLAACAAAIAHANHFFRLY